jgi:hypothetical protein
MFLTDLFEKDDNNSYWWREGRLLNRLYPAWDYIKDSSNKKIISLGAARPYKIVSKSDPRPAVMPDPEIYKALDDLKNRVEQVNKKLSEYYKMDIEIPDKNNPWSKILYLRKKYPDIEKLEELKKGLDKALRRLEGSKKHKLIPQQTSEAAGVGVVAANKKMAKDPRYANAMTVDIHPGETQKQAAKFGNKTDKMGNPPQLRSDGKI